jgi:lactate dehydrogenase-like 2-hydroxyacid dehydrogenase
MKALFCYRIPSLVQDYFKKNLPPAIELICPQRIDENTLIDLSSDVDVLISYKISNEVLKAAKKLKHIQVPWTGSESLDFDVLKNYPHITVSNSHSNALVIAEHAVALLVAAAKRLIISDQKMRKGDWSARYDAINSHWLSEKSLGVIGYGAIGKIVARMMKSAFNMKILAIKRFPEKIDPDAVYDYLGGQDLKDREYVFKNSDFFLVTLPLTEETKDLIGEKEISSMKPNAIIVNISRGSVINEKALYEALRDKKIAAAGLDVWYNYPKDRKNPVNVFQNYPFRELDNVILSPHRAFRVHQRGDIVSADDVIDNLILLSKGKEPKNQLNMELGY